MGRPKRKAVNQPEPVLQNQIYTQEPLITIPGTPMSFEAIGNYEKYFKNSGVHVERALDYSSVSERFKGLIKHYSWDKLVAQKPKKFNITRIREFYAAISGCDSDTNIIGVTIMGVTIPFAPKDINKYLGCLDVNENELYSAKWDIEYKPNLKAKALECQQLLCPNGRTDKNSFTFGSADKDVKDLKHLISHNILPSWKINEFYYTDACLALAIWKKEPVDIGKIIHKTACDFAIKMKVGNIIPYPYLVDALCDDKKVPELDGDKYHEPHEISLGTHTKSKADLLKEGESISRSAITIDTVSSSNTSEMMNLEKNVEELKGDVVLLNNNVVKLDANVTGLMKVVTDLNDSIIRMTNNFIVSNDNMERFKAIMIEDVRQLNGNMIQGYNRVSDACADLRKKLDGLQYFQPGKDIVQKWQPPNSILSKAIPTNTLIFRPSALDNLTIPYMEGTKDAEPSKTKGGRKASQPNKKNNGRNLSTLATAAMSYEENPTHDQRQ